MIELSEWFIIGFWVLAGLAIILGVAISAEEWITEKLQGGRNGQDHR